YRIDALIGRGGMASVYRAYQPSLGRFVAIKVPSVAVPHDRTSIARFHREAHAVAQLDHPHILPIYDFGEANGLPYIVMPLVSGGSLADRTGWPLSFEWCLSICRQVGEALDYAHERGIVHRDVKPSNILLTRGDHARLADFGIASWIGAALDGPSASGGGTPEYVS